MTLASNPAYDVAGRLTALDEFGNASVQCVGGQVSTQIYTYSYGWKYNANGQLTEIDDNYQYFAGQPVGN